MTLKALSNVILVIVSSVHSGPAIDAAVSFVIKISIGMMIGNPSMAISVALLPAREAMAPMRVKRKEYPVPPRSAVIRNNGRFCTGSPIMTIKTENASNISKTVNIKLYNSLETITACGLAM